MLYQRKKNQIKRWICHLYTDLRCFPHIYSLLIWRDKELKSTNSWPECREWRAKYLSQGPTCCLALSAALNLLEIHNDIHSLVVIFRNTSAHSCPHTRTHAHTLRTHSKQHIDRSDRHWGILRCDIRKGGIIQTGAGTVQIDVLGKNQAIVCHVPFM